MLSFSQSANQALGGGLRWFSKRAAAQQGGLLDGQDPATYNPSDPLRIWIIQVGVILMMTQFLSLLLRKMHQPKVIAEVLGGILLGPTAFGRIPGFTEHIFPSQSVPYLSLSANIGLVLFLFLVGMEIDAQVIKRNARQSATISLGGMILPFGLGSAYSIALYKEFINPDIKFSYFMLFVGVAFSITAFPVLCRILTELKLFDTTVGVVVLSAGVGNDIVGWTLLALSVALVNASSGLTAVWILLLCIAWALFLLFVVRRLVYWLARRTGSIENGPTTFFMTVMMLLVFASAFFTDVIGVQAIFGGFLAGLIIPREGGLTIALTEKLEDMVSIIFLPIYFTLSGLSTNLGLLNNGITWAYTIGIIALAYIGKFGGCTIAARTLGFQWREAASIGTLMSCKGLVELIVLNVGLSAGILDTRVFSMFVLEALVLTFMTTPVVVKIYPPKYRKRAVPLGSNFDGIEKGSDDEKQDNPLGSKSSFSDDFGWKARFTVVLDKMEHLPGLMTVSQLFRPVFPESEDFNSSTLIPSSNTSYRSRIIPTIDALRLIELSDRTSAVMKSSVADSLIYTDPLLNVFRAFSELNNIPVSGSLSVVPWTELGAKVAEHARDTSSQLVIVPWLPPSVPMVHHHADHQHQQLFSSNFSTNNTTTNTTPAASSSPSLNPFDTIFHFGITEQSASALHAQFARSIFSNSKVDVALYVERGSAGPGHSPRQRIFMPFFGGSDDRLALKLVIQLCTNPWTTAKVVRVRKTFGDIHSETTSTLTIPEPAHQKQKSTELTPFAEQHTLNLPVVPDTVYANATTQTRLQSETADSLVWQTYTTPQNDTPNQSPEIRNALTRIQFTELESSTPLHDLLRFAESEVSNAAETSSSARSFVIVGRGRKLNVGSHSKELSKFLEKKGVVGNEVKKTMGDVATAVIASGLSVGLLVVQSAAINNGDA